MVKILHYIGSLDFGGSQSFVMELYRKIDKEKVQFDFVTFPGENRGIYKEVRGLGGQIFECPRYSGVNHFAFCRWWDSFLKEHPEYQIVHGHVRSCASVYMPIVKKHDRTAIVHSHSTSNGKGVSAVVKAVLQWPIRYIADYLFSCSEIAGIWLYGAKAIRKPNYRMIPNCVDCSRFAYSPEKRSQTRRMHGLTEDTFVIGHIGRFHEAKNHRFIIDVFASVLSDKPEAKLLLVGDGELRKQIEDYAEAKGVRKNVLFVGSRADTENYYAMMDVFVLPSLWEGLPVCAVEAQASGLPCLLSDTITRDVNLTDQVTYASLRKGSEDWAQMVLQYVNRMRRGINEEKAEKLLQFDSAHVAKELQEFYLQINRGG